ncbi:MAG TPA: FAD-dependent oxidoreductase [Candidatus Kapabacteria bacterium]|nr:FAD-dependent oxidoreductase [Candidatus Kapabacteria bacterium]
MITIIGGGFSGLSAAYFLHRAGKDVTLLEWSRGLGGRASTRNVGYRTMDSGAQRIDLSPLSANQLETDARALLRAVAIERGVLQQALPFPSPVFRFDGRSLETAHQVEVPNWSYLEGGMRVLADALVKDIPVRTHTRVSDIVFEKDSYQLRNQRGETMSSDGVVIALPAPYALALLLPHAAKNKKVKRITDLFNDVNYEPMIGAMFGTTKINFPEPFAALYTDDVTAPIFWLSQESLRRPLGVRKNEMAFVLQLGAEISRDYVLKSDKETFVAVERVFEEVLDVALPDIIYGEIQRWAAAFLSSSPFTVDTIKEDEFKVPLYLAGDYVAGQSSIASAFWSGKQIADRLAGVDTFQYIEAPAREQARLAEAEWKAVVPPEKAPRKKQKPQRKHAQKKYDKEKGKRVFVPAEKKEGRKYGSKPGGARPQGRGKGPQRAGQQHRPGGQRGGGWQQGARPAGARPRQQRAPGQGYAPRGQGQGYAPRGQGQGYAPRGQGQGYGQRGPGQGYEQRGPGQGYEQRGPARTYGQRDQGRGYAPRPSGGPPRQQRPAGPSRSQWGAQPQGGRSYGQGQGQGQGYGRTQGGYGQQSGQGRSYGQGRPQRPRPQGNPQGEQGGYRPREYGRGFGKPQAPREPSTYSTNVPQRPATGRGDYQPRTSGYESPNAPRRPRRPSDDDNIGNR